MKAIAIFLLGLKAVQAVSISSPSDEAERLPIGARDAGYPGWQYWTPVSRGDSQFNPGAFVSSLDSTSSVLFAVRKDGIVCTTSLNIDTNEYKPWTPTGSNYKFDLNSRITATFNILGRRAELYATAVDGYVWTTYQYPDGSWHVWDPVSTSTRMGTAAPITATWNGNLTTLELITTSTNGTMVPTSRTNLGAWSQWSAIRPDTSVPPGAFITSVGDNTDDGNRRLFVVDKQGSARCCPWSFSYQSWQYCYEFHPRVMRPGALISARDHWMSPLLVTTSSDGYIWTSDRFQHDDWTGIVNSTPVQPGAEATLYVQGDNQFIYGTDKNGLIRFTGRTRDSATSDWVVWSNVMPFNVIPGGAAVNAVRNRGTGNMTAFILTGMATYGETIGSEGRFKLFVLFIETGISILSNSFI